MVRVWRAEIWLKSTSGTVLIWSSLVIRFELAYDFFFFLVQEVFDNMWQPAVSKCWHSVPPIHVLPLEVLKHADRAHKYSGYLNVERPFPVFVSYGVSLRSRCCLPGWQVLSVSSCVVVLEQGVVCVFVLPCLVIRWVFFYSWLFERWVLFAPSTLS